MAYKVNSRGQYIFIKVMKLTGEPVADCLQSRRATMVRLASDLLGYDVRSLDRA
jgi:hypothetical protein